MEIIKVCGVAIKEAATDGQRDGQTDRQAADR